MLRRIDVIGLAVVIDEQIHITRHLPAFEMGAENIKLRMLRSRPTAKVFVLQLGALDRLGIFLRIRHIQGPMPGVGTEATHIGIRTSHCIRNRHT